LVHYQAQVWLTSNSWRILQLAEPWSCCRSRVRRSSQERFR